MKRWIDATLKQWKDRPGRKPLVVQGARQVGKTYALEKFGRESFPQCHVVNFEQNPLFCRIFQDDLAPERIVSELGLVLGKRIDPGADLLILDEIQECPLALTALKYFAERMPQMAVCAAGSLLGVRLGDSSFPVGKVEELRMAPMPFEEFLWAGPNAELAAAYREVTISNPPGEVLHGLLWREFRFYMLAGGLPECVESFQAGRGDLHEASREVRKIQNRLAAHHLADMAKHSGRQNAMHLERLWRNIPAQLGRDLSGSAPKFVFKDAVPGLRGYERMAGAIDWLEAAGLALRHPIVDSGRLPFPAHERENFFKLFLFDVGLLGALGQLPTAAILQQDFGSFKGYCAENFVAQEFHAAGLRSVCWREGRAEVEFLFEREGCVVPVEVKSGHVTHAKSLGSFQAKYQPPAAYILSGRAGAKPSSVRRHLPIYMAAKLAHGG
jgi:uncharacterized protein